MRQHVAAFANLVCRFGDDNVLLDYASEIVLPAFLDKSLVRSYGSSQFFFYETELVELYRARDELVLGVSGRFIHNTLLMREQIFVPRRGVIRDEATLPSAPSASFLLVLNNHRLIYFPETAHAPDLSVFRSTLLHFLKYKHKEFINKEYERLRQLEQRVTKKDLNLTHPFPSLELIPISGGEEIERFLKRYKILKKIDFRLITPNDEIDGAELFDDVRTYFSNLEPETMKIEAKNPKGLDIPSALPVIKAATATANQEVKLTGVDYDGNDLRGDNKEFQVSAPIDPIPATRSGLIQKLYSVFSELQASGVIHTGEQSEQVTNKIRNLRGLL